jgi:hypothetical protein
MFGKDKEKLQHDVEVAGLKVEIDQLNNQIESALDFIESIRPMMEGAARVIMLYHKAIQAERFDELKNSPDTTPIVKQLCDTCETIDKVIEKGRMVHPKRT